MAIAPGGTGAVEVRVVPVLAGEKIASVILKTDSPLSPEIVLNIRVIGNRKPPFMHQASGDLNFEAESLSKETREIHAFTVELIDSSPTSPIVKAASQFLRIGPAKLWNEQADTSEGSVARHYVYELKLTTEPPGGRFSDEVVVIDPWDTSLQQRLRVHGAIQPALRIAPSRVILLASSHSDHRDVTKQLLVTSKTPMSDLVVETDQKVGSPLVLGAVKIAEGGRQASFSVGLAPGVHKNGDHQVLVGPTSSAVRVVVPVAIRVEEYR